MRAPRIVLAGGLGALLGACAGAPTVPLQRYSLGMARAEYRDYAGARATLCDAEPRWLSDELSSVNGMLSRFLASTREATDPEALHHAEQLELLKEATRSLPPVLEIHQKNLGALSQCSFRRSGAFPEVARRGEELLKLAQARLAEAPAALAAVELQQAQKKWVEEAPAREATARQTWCAANVPIGQADLYFARQYADGRSEWLFCDGLKVEEPVGGEPQIVIPEGISRRERRRIQPEHYLDAAKAYPASEVDRQPGTSPGAGSDSTQQAKRGD